MNTTNISAPASLQDLLTAPAITTVQQPAPGTAFSELMADLIRSTDGEQQQIGHEVDQLLTGEASNFHEISLAVARADLSFRFMMQIRDQLIGTYREVMRMQV